MVANYSPCRCVTAARRCLLWLIRRPLILRGREGHSRDNVKLSRKYIANCAKYLSINIFSSFSRYLSLSVCLLATNTYIPKTRSIRPR